MKHPALPLSIAVFLLLTSVGNADTSLSSDWKYLLNSNLDGWEAFTGIPHKSVEVPGYGKSQSEDCRVGQPVGLGDPMKIFEVEMVKGSPILRVSGQIYAGLSTVDAYSNYHLSMEYQWGEKKYAPRLNRLRDSGVLVHCNGKHGAFWNVWMQSLECQVQEGDTGDFIALAGTSANTRVTTETKSDPNPQYSELGEVVSIGQNTRWGCQRLVGNLEKEDWNLVEIFAVDDQVRFCLNGTVVMHLTDTKIGSQADGAKLSSGRIQLQSEAAEISYRNIKIRKIERIPVSTAAQ